MSTITEPHITTFCARLYAECYESFVEHELSPAQEWPQEAVAFLRVLARLRQYTGISAGDCREFIRRCGLSRDWSEREDCNDISWIAQRIIDWHTQDRPSYQKLIRSLVKKHPQVATRMRLPGSKAAPQTPGCPRLDGPLLPTRVNTSPGTGGEQSTTRGPASKRPNGKSTFTSEAKKEYVLDFVKKQSWDGTLDELRQALAKKKLKLSRATLSRYLRGTKYVRSYRHRAARSSRGGRFEREAVATDDADRRPLEAYIMPDDEDDAVS